MDGILYIDKQVGWTSFDVVAKVRGLLRAQTDVKRPKVGHCGTLDPNATGLLLIVTGSYCKRAQEFSGMEKSYEATIHLGVTSTTGDDEGEKTEQNASRLPSTEAIDKALKKYTGTIQQTPPAYSAVKVGGKRAYALARAGKAVKIEPRMVTIH
ncbi:MAG: tRNA pseudouridine(55) synthase, partial [Actinobacteria bacterium]|nr:tRNA pseudouridine(55) synthase [Actinomycetota bacterium]